MTRNKTVRKVTTFSPCEKHKDMYSRETRYRRAETMAEGGWGGQGPCSCSMNPGTDIFCREFVVENPTYFANR